jgi:tetratricopeptide (TPR) repeat protein/cellulose synthase/poly-beta-1,6-N-acetylglucosamine synthase-like glycosyltransferase
MKQPRYRKPVILVSSAVALYYLVYRVIWTLNLTSPYAICASVTLYIAEVYGVMNMLLFFFQVWDTSEPPQQPVLEGRTVDVFVPTYNEDPDLLRVTLSACVAMDYPHRTYLCDDGGTDARINDKEKGPGSSARAAILKAICAEVGAIYMTRPKNEHAKAGNLNHAFARTDGEFIIIFDADHVPDPNFITRLIGYFADDKLAFVQTPHAFYNFESFQARLNHEKARYWEEGQLFYHVIQPGRNRWNAPIFAGSAAMFRRKALEEVGYIATETITEDMHTGLRMHTRGWTSLGISERMITGQAAQDVTTFHSQRLRWGEGNMSVMAHDNPLTTRGLSFGQRLCYFATIINWCGGLFKIPIYLTPLLMLITGVPPVNQLTLGLGLLMAAYMAVCILGTKYVSNGYGSMWYSELFNMASFWTQAHGTMRALFFRKFQVFIVTAKRGRQSKSIWRFIRPQVYLIVLSVFALAWAWGRLWFGVSDDFFKPVLASFWTVFHALLAYLVVRRACWEDDRRYSTRHVVHLPISYRRGGAAESFGVSVDLNERGVGFIAYERLSEGDVLQLTVQAPNGKVTVEGVIRSVRELGRPLGAGQPSAGYRYGVHFQNTGTAETDALHRITLHYAVPRLYRFYAEGHRSLPEATWVWLKRVLLCWRRSVPRREYHLPLFLNPDDTGACVPTVTEDLSRTNAAVILSTPLPEGLEVPLRMVSPLGEMRGRAHVVRQTPCVYAARTYYHTVLEFTGFEPGGWDVLHDLLTPAAARRLHPVLQPARRKRPVPMDRPLIRAAALLLPLLAAEYGLFRWTYADDFFLRNTANSTQTLTASENDRLDRILKETLRDPHPSTDRLVLLSRVLQRMDRYDDLAQVIKRLAPRDPNNPDLRLALAHAHARNEDYGEADAEFERLLGDIDRGKLSESHREEILAAAARNAVHSGDMERAVARYQRLFKHFPEMVRYRSELAGALLAANRLDEAAQVYQGTEPDDDGRMLLVLIWTAAGKHAEAVREARALAQSRPGDPLAEGLLADVLQAQGDYKQARVIYLRLLNSNSGDLRLAVQLAHSSLWGRNYPEALDRFQGVLDRIGDRPEQLRKYPDVPRGYVNAAASAPRLEAAQRNTALSLAERALDNGETDVVYLTRLAWMLHRLGETDRRDALLEKAVALEPREPATRRQLASVLMAAGQAEPARKALEGVASELEVKLLLADSYAMSRDYSSAAQVCRDILRDHPGNVEARVRLANVLSWNRQFAESLKVFEELAHDDPKNPVYPVRLAEVTLWSGDTREAVRRYEILLRTDFDRPELWWGFVDAAAGTERLTEAQAQVATAIADKARKGEHVGPRVVETFRKSGRPLTEETFLARLAWALHHNGRAPDHVAALLDRAVSLAPREPSVRKEVASVLAAVDRFPEAIRLYDGMPLERADRLQLARFHAGVNNWTAATEQCRLVLNTQPLDREARVLLADVLTWSGRHAEALTLLESLVRADPGDTELVRRQAEVTLWSGDAPAALRLYQSLLEARFDQQVLWSGYLDAAGQVAKLTPDQERLAARIVEQPIADQPEHVELLCRAAWVKHRHLNDPSGAKALLNRAVALRSRNPAVLARLAWILDRVGDAKAADGVLRQALELKPKARAVRLELASVAAGTRHFAEARKLYEELVAEAPGDRAVQARLAEATLWCGGHAEAVERLRLVLDADFQQPSLWRSYVDAVASAPTLTDVQLKLLLRIADETTPVEEKEARTRYLSRLAWALRREGDRCRDANLRARADTFLNEAVALGSEDAATQRELAGVLVAARRCREALPLVEKLAALDPRDTELRAYLANVTFWAGDAATALERFRVLLEEDFKRTALWTSYVDAAAAVPPSRMTPAQTDLLLRLAERPVPTEAVQPAAYLARLAWALHREGRKELAATLLDRALALDPKDAAVRREVAGMLSAVGRHKEALAWLDELARRNPNDEGLAGQVAQQTLWSGDVDRALDLLQRRLEARFEQPELWLCFVDAASGLNQGRMTRDQLRLVARIAEQQPPEAAADRALYLSRLAWVLHREGFTAQAVAVLDRAVALKPEQPATRRELARVLVAAGRTADGLRLYEGLTLDAEDHFQLVVLHASARQFAEAVKHCRDILREKPGDARARRWLADLSLWGNDYPAAVVQYQALLTENFEQPALWPGYVEAVSFVGTPNADQVRLVERIRERSDDARDAVFLARLSLVLNQHVERPRYLPGHVTLALGSATCEGPLPALCALVAEQARPSESRRLFERALSLRPKDPTALARLAWVAHRLGNPASARLLDEAIALHPPEPAVRRELGDVLVATGRLTEAQRWFEELVAAYPARGFRIRLAEVTVWAGQYDLGLERVVLLLGEEPELRSLWPVFVDAAASTKGMNPAQIDMALRLAKQPVPVEGPDAQALYLSRLAWALLREGGRAEKEEWRSVADGLLGQALRLPVRDAAVRRQLASVLTAGKRFRDALVLYEALVGEFPGDVDLRTRLAEVTLWSGDRVRGLARFEQLLLDGVRTPRAVAGYVAAAAAVPSISREQADLVRRLCDVPALPDRGEEAAFRSRLAWVLLREGRAGRNTEWLTQSGRQLDAAVSLQPTEASVRRELAGVLGASGRYAEGLKLYEGLKPELEDRLSLAGLYAGVGKLDEARQQVDAVLAQRPNDPEARLWLVRLALGRGRCQEALELLEVLLEEDFARPELWRMLADAAGGADGLTERQLRLALRVADQPLREQPNAVSSLTRLAWALWRQGQKSEDEALRRRAALLAEQAVAVGPKEPAECRELAGVLAAVGRPDAAAQLLGRLDKLDVADRVLLVRVLAARKDLDAAEAEARKLVADNPRDFEARFLLADMLMWNHKAEQALAVYETLFAERPDDVRLPRKLAEASLGSGRYDDALKRYQHLLSRDWRQPELWSGYVDAASSATAVPPEPHKALLLRIADRTANSQDPLYLARLGWVMRRLEEPAKSVTFLKRAVELDPKARTVRRQLAEALYAAGDFAEAERQFQVLLRQRD